MALAGISQQLPRPPIAYLLDNLDIRRDGLPCRPKQFEYELGIERRRQFLSDGDRVA